MRATVTSGASSALATADPAAVDSSYLLKNATATAIVYLEVGAAATAADGFAWDPADGPLALTLDRGETLNARSAGATQTIHLLRSGR